MSEYLLAKALRDIDLLSKVHTSGLLLRHRQQDSQVRREIADRTQQLEALQAAVEAGDTALLQRLGVLAAELKQERATRTEQTSSLQTSIDEAGKLCAKREGLSEAGLAALRREIAERAAELEALRVAMGTGDTALLQRLGVMAAEAKQERATRTEQTSALVSLVDEAGKLTSKHHGLAEAGLAALRREIADQTQQLEALRAELDRSSRDTIHQHGILDRARIADVVENNQKADALMGRVVLSVAPSVVSVSSVTLNAAGVGEYVTRIGVHLVNPLTGEVHRWIRGERLRASLVATVPGGVPAPTISDPVELEDGSSLSILTWGTGTGTYDLGVVATGTITCVAAANLLDGETVTIKDCHQKEVVFEFDDDGAVTAGRVRVPVVTGATANDVAHALAVAIRTSGMRLTTDVTAAVLTLTQHCVGDIGNNAIGETVAHVGFVVAGFSGGNANKIVVTFKVESALDANDDRLPFGNFTLVPVTQTFVVV